MVPRGFFFHASGDVAVFLASQPPFCFVNMGMSQNPLVKVPKITQNRSWLLYLWMFSGYLVLTHTQYHLTVGIIITIILIVIIPIFKIYSSPGVDRTWYFQEYHYSNLGIETSIFYLLQDDIYHI